MLTLMKKENAMSNIQKNDENKIDWWAVGTAALVWFSLADTFGQRQALEDARADKLVDSIDRISRWF